MMQIKASAGESLTRKPQQETGGAVRGGEGDPQEGAARQHARQEDGKMWRNIDV
jgi:hypothetical protein